MKILNACWMVLAVGALTLGQVARAEEAPDAKKGGHGPTVDQILEKMTTELKLSDEQKPKVKAVLEEGQKARAALKETAKEERAEKAKALFAEQDKKMKALLTAEQLPKYEAMQEEMKKKMAEKRKKGGS
ncbi:MAG: hypothetical protein J0L75_06990 [Spirochaetes bacterium]|nr:hypothetical protein [Spirochaetota bacterium]